MYVNSTAIKDPEVRKWMIGKDPVDYCKHRNKPLEIGYKRMEEHHKVWESGIEKRWEEEFKTPNGKCHYIRRLTPIKNADGETELVTAYGVEITERIVAERKLEKSEAIHKHINFFSNSLFDKNTEQDILEDIIKNCVEELNFEICGIYACDYANHRLIFLAGHGGSEHEPFPGTVICEKNIMGPVANTGTEILIEDIHALDDRKLLFTESRSAISIPIKSTEGIIGIMQAEHPQPGFFSEFHLGILRVICSICATKLIKARADQEILEAKEAAEAAAGAKTQFLSTMSHEIRTPMNAVIGLSHLLLTEDPKTEQLENLKTLHFSANHLLSLVNDILDFSKLESGKFEFEQLEFELEELFQNVKQTFSFQAQERRLFLQLETIAHSYAVIGDVVRLNQILTNLIGNALKFTPEGGVTFGFEILEETEKESHFYFYIKDTGIGIAENKLDAVFSQFVQASADTTRKYGGTGLGLTICKKLVELQGGEIGVESEFGKGTTFWFKLSYRKGKQKKRGTTKTFAGKAWQDQDLEGMRVLLVEDNKVNIMVGKKYLKKWKVITDTAVNGEIAVEKIANNKYDLVLMDLNMPVMGGLEASELVREMEGDYYQKLPIIALTADVSENIKQHAAASGMNDFLSKPFEPELLFGVLKNYYSTPISASS